jgi:hypothetical protein
MQEVDRSNPVAEIFRDRCFCSRGLVQRLLFRVILGRGLCSCLRFEAAFVGLMCILRRDSPAVLS